MRKILTVAALTTLIAAPAFAFSSDAEIRAVEEWQQLVEQVQAKHRTAQTGTAAMGMMAQGGAAVSTSDGVPPGGNMRKPPAADMHRPYSTTLEILQDR